MCSLSRSGIGRLSILVASLATALPGVALEFHQERRSAYDLEIKGRIEGLGAVETRYVSWQALRGLPSRRLRVDGEFVPGEQEVTVVMLDDFLAALPRAEGADGVIATCTDGYAAIYTAEYRTKYKPFLILEINGEGPEKWPPKGLAFNPGPYVISIADELAPGVSKLQDASHKRPWGVDSVEIVDYSERFAPFYRAPVEGDARSVSEGREIWINSCFSCHDLPEFGLGGTKAARPMQIVMMQAVYNPDYFNRYVRAPSTVNPAAKMTAHPHYSDAQLDDLRSFLKSLSVK